MTTNGLTSDDILQPLPFEQWPLLKDTLKRDWPQFAYQYYWVDNAIQWKNKDPHVKRDIYCPEGRYDKGVYVGISFMGIYYVHFFTFNESKDIFFDCLTKTNRIDWSKFVVIAAVHNYYLDVVDKALECLRKSIGLEVECYERSIIYYKTKEECAKVDVTVPDGYELRPLTQSDVPLIHDQWPLVTRKRDPKLSEYYISTLIRLNGGLGLFDKNEDSLVCWVCKSEWGGLTTLQTVKEYKRNGFAKLIVKAYCKILAEEGLDTTLLVKDGNTVAENLFDSLNYKRVNVDDFIVTKPLLNRLKNK